MLPNDVYAGGLPPQWQQPKQVQQPLPWDVYAGGLPQYTRPNGFIVAPTISLQPYGNNGGTQVNLNQRTLMNMNDPDYRRLYELRQQRAQEFLQNLGGITYDQALEHARNGTTWL